MKKIFLTLAAAVLLSASAIAQDDNRRQQRPRMDRTEMLKMRTEQTAKQYNLDETQTTKLLELNTKYADTMFRGMGQMGQRGDRNGQGMRQDLRTERRQMTDEQRAEMQKRREEMQKQMEETTKELEEKYAKAECPVVSNNSAHRMTADVPMVVPELNPEHIEIIKAQRERLGTKRGFIAVKSNCSLQSYLPAMAVINEKYPIDKAPALHSHDMPAPQSSA